MSSVAKADVVLIGGTPEDSFGNVTGLPADPVLLTVQEDGTEAGAVVPTNTTTTFPNANGVAVNNTTGGTGGNTTPTLSAAGWTRGSEVGIGFNGNQSVGTGVTLNSLVLTIYNGTTPVGSFDLSPASGITFSAADIAAAPGSGTGLFDFVLTAPEETDFNNILDMPGSSGFTAGLAASLGCASTGAPAGCQPTNAGAELFHAFPQSDFASELEEEVIPLPPALPLFATGLGALGLLGWFRKRKPRANLLGAA
jgi:hypothetical protein